VHTLIAAAADLHTTPEDAARLAEAYLSVCVVLTLLDSVIDQRQDERAGQAGYISLYEDRALLAQTLAQNAKRAADQARALPNGAHHVLMLVGVVAYYTSAPEARTDLVRPLVGPLQRSLAPLISLPLAFMRAWRLLRRLR